MDKKIVIFGSGGHGKVILDILRCSGENVAGFLDDDQEKNGREIYGKKILGSMDWCRGQDNVFLIPGIGNNEVRRRIFEEAKDAGVGIAGAVHPGAIVSSAVKLGEGVVIMPGAVVNIDTVIEDGVVINTGATVDHDCRLRKFCQIYPGAHLAGTVEVGEESYVGTGATVIQNKKIGSKTMIGAGAVVVADIEDNVTAVGIPAKKRV